MRTKVDVNDQSARKPNWSEARRFIEAIAGKADPVMTWQTFDDKKAHNEWAEHRTGRLSDLAIQRWLIVKSKKGCGIFVTVNATDGLGRRRKNVTAGRAVWADFDGQPIPDLWPVKPDIIIESSSGRYQVFFLIAPHADLNLVSDTQARIATYYGSDSSIIDPARVCRVPGFDHQKRKPFRSHLIECVEPASVRLNKFDRQSLAAVVAAHPAEYRQPSPRADQGRSDEPAYGWDAPANIERARAYLQLAKPSIEGEGGDNRLYQVSCKLDDFGVSPELSLELLNEDWNGRCEPPWSHAELERKIRNARSYKQNPAGSDSPVAPEDEFPERQDFEGKSAMLNAGGLQYKMANEIEPEKIAWLWRGRFAAGKVSMIAGFPDQGKSQITLNIAAIVSTGGEWPNGEGTADKGGVIILSAEDDAADTLIPRLKAAGADISQIAIPESMVREVVHGKRVERVFNIEDDLKRLTILIEQQRAKGIEVKLVILDPINAYFGGKNKGDAHKTSDMRAMLTPVSKWAARLGIAVIAISHFNKGGNGHTLYRVTDSSAITAVARAVWFAVKDVTTERMMMLSGKNNLARDIGGLGYYIDEKDIGGGIVAPYIIWDGQVALTADEALGARKDPKPEARDDARAFLAELLSGGRMLSSDVQAAARTNAISLASLRRAKEDLAVTSTHDGYGKNVKWYWSLPLVDGDEFEGDDVHDLEEA